MTMTTVALVLYLYLVCGLMTSHAVRKLWEENGWETVAAGVIWPLLLAYAIIWKILK